MAVFRFSSKVSAAEPVWVRSLLGVVLLLSGILVLTDIMLVKTVSAWVIGGAAVVAGAFELIHAFWTKGWASATPRILLGFLYVVFGLVLITQPSFRGVFLTYALGFALVLSGLVRLPVGFKLSTSLGRLLIMLSGAFGIVAGLIILSGWPISGIQVIGTLLAIDLISQGIGWLVVAWRRGPGLSG
ncbi:MAG: DUF308 domain-containing protein [Pseudomonadota bacterium]|uniref:HdeD family acid-resistance protein n=1 Tax=Phenylobacterium sp. TaxID=1871053 RepID=UPI002726BCC2|nr:DUF308 domain-containing protein [Phenylobacterium sp.]MDO9429929.1 DUF308 domain-containing protein [Phenylobacterium sp.]